MKKTNYNLVGPKHPTLGVRCLVRADQGELLFFALSAHCGLTQEGCNNPAFRTKRRVDLGLVCIHASKTLDKFFAK
jgi:hypothetical protein